MPQLFAEVVVEYVYRPPQVEVVEPVSCVENGRIACQLFLVVHQCRKTCFHLIYIYRVLLILIVDYRIVDVVYVDVVFGHNLTEEHILIAVALEVFGQRMCHNDGASY